MTSNVKPIPDGASVVMPMLVCRDAGAEIEFCKTAFGAVERVRRPGPDGLVAHAMITIGAAMIMIEAEWPTLGSRAPQADGSSPVVIYVYVDHQEPILGRSHRTNYGSIWPCVDYFNTRRRNVRGPKTWAMVEYPFGQGLNHLGS